MRNEDQPLVIDSELARRMALNSEMNPRETRYGDATQSLNPITGRPYADGSFMPQAEGGYMDYRKELDKSLITTSYVDLDSRFIIATNKEIELQKALGRMEVREGNINEIEHTLFLNQLMHLAQTYRQNPSLTLDSITDVVGLNAALQAVEKRVTLGNMIGPATYKHRDEYIERLFPTEKFPSFKELAKKYSDI